MKIGLLTKRIEPAQCDETLHLSTFIKRRVVSYFLWVLYFSMGVYTVLRSIQGGPERMQRFWSVISTTFLIECHWFLVYWIEYTFDTKFIKHRIRRFDSRAILKLRQCQISKCALLYPVQNNTPASMAWSMQDHYFKIWRRPICWHQIIIALTLKRKTYLNETDCIFIAQLCKHVW